MNEKEHTPDAGKLSPERMSALCRNCFGAENAATIIGPGAGFDAGILDMGDGRIMAVAEDPIFPAAGLPLETFGWFTVHIGASDVAVTGVKPEFMTYSLLLPPRYPEKDTKTIIRAISAAAKDLKITIAGGHTGWYGAVTVPTIGGITVWGFAGKGNWISPGGARDGDILLMTKGPAIEATGLLAVLNADLLRKRIAPDLLEQAIGRTREITVVRDAETAFACGGVHAMHDATEGGVCCGIWEMSASSGISVRSDFDQIDVPHDIKEIGDVFGYDVWSVISEGTLLIAAAPGSIEKIRKALQQSGSDCFVLGRFDASLPNCRIVRDGKETDFIEPEPDQFWNLFGKKSE